MGKFVISCRHFVDLVVSAHVLVREVEPLVVAERGEDVDDEGLVGAGAAESLVNLLRRPARREPRFPSHGAPRRLLSVV